MIKHRSLFAFLLGSLLICNTALSYAQNEPNNEDQASSLPLKELQMFAQIFGKIKSDYVEAVDDRQMLIDAINGILAGLDPHSSFLQPDAFREIRIDTEGEFGGVGIEVTLEDDQLRVIAPIEDTPADIAGVLAGDIIIKIDGKATNSDTLQEAVKRMRGEIGSKITLTIIRKNESKPLVFEITRDVIQLTSVKSRDLETAGYAYMRISSFQVGTAKSLKKKIETFKKDNDDIRGFILDLRNNPGGTLAGAVDVSDLFLDSGVIVETHGRLKNSESSYKASTPDLINGAPMIVLVNTGSASASEIVAGALQDHHRAIILGTQTFGKGSVQTITPIGNGSALKITTARYYTPNGRSIQETGITPDIISALTDSINANQTIGTREVDLAGHLANPNKQQQALDDQPPAFWENDSQIRDALNLLKGIHLANSSKTSTSG